eukprot:TRINITY_DN27995_c0_g2_i1.p1 TRINITY_DN27995_c0_g2~~TRINITY_DN27995_c0_g2_i1.p1  ORF type:complete len:386 (-),score=40.69 TRINITY_DN27995_c0_g2_i1:148-1239(-)
MLSFFALALCLLTPQLSLCALTRNTLRGATTLVASGKTHTNTNEASQTIASRSFDGPAKVVFGLFTSPKAKYVAQLDAVLSTWASDVEAPHELLIAGVNRTQMQSNIHYLPAPECVDGSPGPGVTCKEATLLTTAYRRGATWAVIGGTDNYIYAKRFLDRLSSEDASVPQILGMFGCGAPRDTCCCADHVPGLCGGGGYAISRAALSSMIGNQSDVAARSFIKEAIHVSDTESMGWSDQVTSCIGRRRGVQQVELGGLHAWRQSLADIRSDIEEPHRIAALTYHYVQPDEMKEIRTWIIEAQNRADRQTYEDANVEPLNDDELHVLYEAQHHQKRRSSYIQAINERMVANSDGFNVGVETERR